jgi:hypothetical protein
MTFAVMNTERCMQQTPSYYNQCSLKRKMNPNLISLDSATKTTSAGKTDAHTTTLSF